MISTYDNKTECYDFLQMPHGTQPQKGISLSDKMLIYGENIDVMKYLLANGYAGKIDLVYIDPPFSTDSVFTIGDNRVSTVSKSLFDKIAYLDTLKGSDYLDFLRLRLVLLRELLSEQGSIYLHIDYKIGHYVKVMMDEIFGFDNFRNDITRIKCNPKNFSRKAYGNIKDMILFYGKTNASIWNEPYEPLEETDINGRFKKVDSKGRHYTTVPLHAPGETMNGKTGGSWRGMLPPKGRHWRCSPEELDELDANGLIEWSKTGNPRKIIYADEKIKKGKKVQDVWTFKDAQYPTYPTEKNLEMLKFIIKASSNKGSIVLDCFSGSGTTLVASEMLERNWIGIDKSLEGIKVAEKRLSKIMGLFSSEYKRIDFMS